MTTKTAPEWKDSVVFAKLEYHSEYPCSSANRASFGHIPVRLHAEVKQMAKDHHMDMAQVLVALMHHYKMTTITD